MKIDPMWHTACSIGFGTEAKQLCYEKVKLKHFTGIGLIEDL